MKLEVTHAVNRKTAKKIAKKLSSGMVAFPIGMQHYGIVQARNGAVSIKRVNGSRSVYPFHWTQLA